VGAGLAMNSRMHSSSVPSNSKYGPGPSMRRLLLSEGHFRRMAGASKLTCTSGPVAVGHFPIAFLAGFSPGSFETICRMVSIMPRIALGPV